MEEDEEVNWLEQEVPALRGMIDRFCKEYPTGYKQMMDLYLVRRFFPRRLGGVYEIIVDRLHGMMLVYMAKEKGDARQVYYAFMRNDLQRERIRDQLLAMEKSKYNDHELWEEMVFWLDYFDRETTA